MKKNKKENLISKVKKEFWNFQKRVVPKEKNEEISELPDIKLDLEKVVVELSPKSVFKSALVVLILALATYMVFAMSNILMLFFISFFVASALDPLIDNLQKIHIPRAIGLLLVYLVIFILVTLFFANLLPLVAAQLFGLANAINNFIVGLSTSPVENLPFGVQLKPYLEQLYQAIDIKVVAVQLQDSLQLVSSQILNLGGNLWSVLLQVSNGLFNLILVLILVFFMTVDEQALENFSISLFPERYSLYISKRLEMVKTKIGQWIRGQILISLVAAFITFIGLSIAGVEFSLLISVITGICMIVPVFGRVVAAILALPIVLNQSPALALFLIIFYFAVSQVENNILVPLLMNKAVGLSPIIIIFALMVGFQFMGVLGLVLAIPVATIVSIFAKDIGKRIHQS